MSSNTDRLLKTARAPSGDFINSTMTWACNASTQPHLRALQAKPWTGRGQQIGIGSQAIALALLFDCFRAGIWARKNADSAQMRNRGGFPKPREIKVLRPAFPVKASINSHFFERKGRVTPA